MKILGYCLAAIVLLVSINGWAQDKGYKIIVNASNPVSVLHKAELSDIFLKKMTKFPDGRGVAPVDLTVNSSTRELFSEDVHKKSSAAVDSYWAQLLFSGRGVPPAKRSENDALDYVRSNPNGISYVSAGVTLDGVKAIRIVD